MAVTIASLCSVLVHACFLPEEHGTALHLLCGSDALLAPTAALQSLWMSQNEEGPFNVHWPAGRGVMRQHAAKEGSPRRFSRMLLSRVPPEGFLEGASQWVLQREKGSQKGFRRRSCKRASRRCLEGRTRPFGEYDPLGVCPRIGDGLNMVSESTASNAELSDFLVWSSPSCGERTQ